MGSLATVFGRSIAAALRPSNAPWAVGPALWATGTAALIAGTGALFGELQLVGLAYLGAACAVIFLVRGFYRARWWAWLAQAVGGAVGISVGAQLWPGFGVGQVLTAAVAGAISGMVGGTGPSGPAFGLMLSVGVAFGQFGGSSLPWWQQAVCYLVGTSVAAVSVLAPWAFHRDKPERRAQAAVYFAAVDLCAAIGTREASADRARLAAARPSHAPRETAAVPIEWPSRRPPCTPRAGRYPTPQSRRSVKRDNRFGMPCPSRFRFRNSTPAKTRV
jgi:hypothetical protein